MRAAASAGARHALRTLLRSCARHLPRSGKLTRATAALAGADYVSPRRKFSFEQFGNRYPGAELNPGQYPCPVSVHTIQSDSFRHSVVLTQLNHSGYRRSNECICDPPRLEATSSCQIGHDLPDRVTTWTPAPGASACSGLGQSLSAEEAVKETPAPERALELHNTHTGETVNVVYRRGDEYDAAALAKLRNILRDHRNGEAHDIDLALYDQLYDLALAAKCDPRYEIISGYRSPESNAKMAAAEQRRRQEFAAHAGPRHRRAPARAVPAPNCAISRWPRPRAAWATTSARISSMSTRAASAPGSADRVPGVQE